MLFFFSPRKAHRIWSASNISPERLKKEVEADLSPCFAATDPETQRVFLESHNSNHCKYSAKLLPLSHVTLLQINVPWKAKSWPQRQSNLHVLLFEVMSSLSGQVESAKGLSQKICRKLFFFFFLINSRELDDITIFVPASFKQERTCFQFRICIPHSGT